MNSYPEKDMQDESCDSVSGIVDFVRYQNEENGHAVFDIDVEDTYLVTAVGKVPYLDIGDKITVYGRWTNHPTYGRQFQVESYEKGLPDDPKSMELYLASGAVKGIGPRTAAKIIEKFGNDAFFVIENHPDWLTDIPGVTEKKAQEISKSFRTASGSRYVMMFCKDFFTPQTSMRIYNRWGGSAVDRIRSNPYMLCDEFRGISFQRADQIAIQLGESPDSYNRIIHGLLYVLNDESVKSGHTCLPEDELLHRATELLFSETPEDGHVVKTVLEKAAGAGDLVTVTWGGEEFVFHPETYRAESRIAKKLVTLDASCPRLDASNALAFIRKIENQSGISYSTEQKNAIYQAMTNGVFILTGGPGTGKTTIIKALLSIFSSIDFRISLAAPTGRAAKRMSEATSHEAKTIHRLLEMEYSENDDRAEFQRNESNNLEVDVIIIDEVSMVDVFLMDSLLKATKNGTRLILIGDADQLPSVGAGNVLHDMIDSERFTTIRLTEIFRQSGNSLISSNAHLINEGRLPDISKKDGDFFFLKRTDEKSISDTVVDLISSRLPKSYGDSVIEKIQIITPSRKGESGTENLNALLQEKLNPPSPGKAERKFRSIVFREGDRVMQTRNNYSAEWTSADGQNGLGIFNGETGRITDIDTDENVMSVTFDDKACDVDYAMLEDLEHSYAITVHKSQGSEYPVVIIPLYSCAAVLQSRNLLYTAVTRASKMVILVGKPEVLRNMIANNHHVRRYSMLKKFLIDA